MCIVFLWRRKAGTNTKIKFILAANRDEFFKRPAKEAQFWEEDPNILSGRDLTEGVSGGTWTGMTRQGKIAFLTNIRGQSFGVDPDKAEKKGRGSLISDFLTNQQTASEYLRNLEGQRRMYKPFNLVCGDLAKNEFYYANSVDEAPPTVLETESLCVSNGTIDCKWFKVERSREKFQKLINDNVNIETMELTERVLDFLTNTEKNYPDPNITVDNKANEYLSSIFIPMIPEYNYGTRTNTVVIVDEKNHATFLERTMLHPDDPVSKWKRSVFEFDLASTHSSSSDVY